MTDAERAIIWDMDGVLVDSNDLHFETARQVAAEEFGLPLEYEQFVTFFGQSDRDIIRALAPDPLTESEIARIAEYKQALYAAAAPERVQPIPGAHELLKACAEAGWRQAVATSAPLPEMALILDLFGLRRWLGVTASSDEVERGKPDPMLFRLAAKRLGVRPGHCVVIEDAVAGVQGAQAAGMVCLAVATTRRAEELAAAERVVETLVGVTPEEIGALLEER